MEMKKIMEEAKEIQRLGSDEIRRLEAIREYEIEEGKLSDAIWKLKEVMADDSYGGHKFVTSEESRVSGLNLDNWRQQYDEVPTDEIVSRTKANMVARLYVEDMILKANSDSYSISLAKAEMDIKAAKAKLADIIAHGSA